MYAGYRRAVSMIWWPRWACRPGVSKSEVSRICAGLTPRSRRFQPAADPHRVPVCVLRCDPLHGTGRTWCLVGSGGGHRARPSTGEALGTAVGDSESYEFWREFLASLKAWADRGICDLRCP